MSLSLFEAFGVESPNADTKKIPLEKVVSLGGDTSVTPDPSFQFEYRPLRRTLRNIGNLQPMWCWGPSGCGKTEYFVQIAARLQRPCHVISFGEETSVRELMGSFALTGNDTGTGFKTEFRYGQLIKAMQDPGALIVLDEFNMAPAAVAAQFNRTLETRALSIPDTAETIRAAEDVCFVATANTPGVADDSGIYAGSQAQNGATRSRFAGLRMQYLPAAKEEAILNACFPRLNAAITLPDAARTPSALLVECGSMVRGLVADGAVSLPFTVRQLKNWAGATLQLKDLADAFRDAYYDLLAPHEALPVGEVFHKVFGIRLEN